MAASLVVNPQYRPAPDRDVRFIGDLSGCYVLSSREASGVDRQRVFACRSRSISPKMAVLQAPVQGEVGEPVALRFDGVGLIKASVARKTSDGFIADFLNSLEEQLALAARIDWMKRRQHHQARDLRQQKRWLPREPRSTVLVAGQPALDCFLIDISASGAAVSADFVPELGQPVAVGTLIGRVARRFDSGFAVQFLSTQEAGAVEALLRPPAGEASGAIEAALAKAAADLAEPRPPATPGA